MTKKIVLQISVLVVAFALFSYGMLNMDSFFDQPEIVEAYNPDEIEIISEPPLEEIKAEFDALPESVQAPADKLEENEKIEYMSITVQKNQIEQVSNELDSRLSALKGQLEQTEEASAKADEVIEALIERAEEEKAEVKQ